MLLWWRLLNFSYLKKRCYNLVLTLSMYLFSLIYKLTKRVNSQVQKWPIWEAVYSWVFKGNLPFFFSDSLPEQKLKRWHWWYFQKLKRFHERVRLETHFCKFDSFWTNQRNFRNYSRYQKKREEVLKTQTNKAQSK